MDLTRRKLLDQLIAEAAADASDNVNPAELTDEQLIAYLKAHRHQSPRRIEGLRVVDPTDVPTALYTAYLSTLTDDELIAAYERDRAELTAAEEEKRRRTRPEAVVPPVSKAAPIEPHEVVLEEPMSVEPPRALTPREEWQQRQAEGIAAAMAEELEAGQRMHEETQRLSDVGSYDGPMLGDMLRPKRG